MQLPVAGSVGLAEDIQLARGKRLVVLTRSNLHLTYKAKAEIASFGGQ
jgi:hypothetical protein